MQSLPIDTTAQVDIVLRLAGLMLHKSNIRPRFVECIQAFTTGIGNGPGATLQSLTATYNAAHDRYFQPFIERHPYILENYLVNTIIRCQFPYGKEGMLSGAVPRMSKEFALLTAQFTLMKGLLIGVAGFHREQFAATHVVHAVQAAAKHFEHHPEFLSSAHTLLVESRMDGARGMAILLRNATLGQPSDRQAPTSPSVHTQPPQA
jgi:lysine-N-methylase